MWMKILFNDKNDNRLISAHKLTQRLSKWSLLLLILFFHEDSISSPILDKIIKYKLLLFEKKRKFSFKYYWGKKYDMNLFIRIQYLIKIGFVELNYTLPPKSGPILYVWRILTGTGLRCFYFCLQTNITQIQIWFSETFI